MTTIHSTVEPRKHVRVTAIGDEDVALDVGRPGLPAVSLVAIRIPVAELRAALDKVAPAGSYTRTDEDTPEQYREAWQAAESAVLDERAMRREAEQERDEAAEALDTTLGRAIKAERERDEARARADAAEPRPLTADDIEQLVTQNRYRVADAIRALYPEEPMATDVLAHAVMTALTEPPRPAWADLADTLRAIDPAETLSIDDLAEAAHEQGVRVTGEQS